MALSYQAFRFPGQRMTRRSLVWVALQRLGFLLKVNSSAQPQHLSTRFLPHPKPHSQATYPYTVQLKIRLIVPKAFPPQDMDWEGKALTLVYGNLALMHL